MTYSIKERTGETTIGPDGTVVAEVVATLFWNDERIGKGVYKRVIKPTDDVKDDTTLAARLATEARKGDERTVEVVTR